MSLVERALQTDDDMTTWKTGTPNGSVLENLLWLLCVSVGCRQRNVDADFDVDVDDSKRI